MKKNLFKSLAVMIALSIGFSVFAVSAPANAYAQMPASDISVVVDGRTLQFEAQGPIQIAGRTLVPVRGVFEALGFNVEWESETQTAVVSNERYTIRITIGSDTFTTNGNVHELDVPAQLVGQTTMVPIGLPLASVGFGLEWDGETETVYITSPAPPAQEETPEDAVNWAFFNNLATEFINLLAGGDFEEAIAMFDETMAELIGPWELQAIWEELLTLTGGFIKIHEIRNGEAEGFFISAVIVRFEHTGFVWNVVFNEDGLIAGLNTGGVYTIYREVVTEIILVNGFTNEPVIIGEGTDFPLQGLMSVPTGMDGPVPAVVIVAGSGPSDMDGTFFGSRPYRDIAVFLASNGIAVIRHDKRTFTHGERIVETIGGSATVWHESMEDALLAAEILRNDPRIDSDRVFIIGHSLGGVLAPRIHAATGDFAGLILMAATPRSLMEVLAEQHTSLIVAGFDVGAIDEDTKNTMLEAVEEMRELFATVSLMSEEEAKETFIEPFGVYAYYLLDLEAHPFTRYIQYAMVPILVMQGGRDFQIPPDTCFVMIQELLDGNENATFILFDGLNHSFMPTTATNFGEHAAFMMLYPDNVYEAVLMAIVDWIKQY